MKYAVASKCIHNRNGMCYLLISDPQPCKLCVNFVSADPKLKKDLKISKPLVTFYDLIINDPRYRALFPASGHAVQMSLYSRTEKLPDYEDKNK